jgi:hypothetical protein
MIKKIKLIAVLGLVSLLVGCAGGNQPGYNAAAQQATDIGVRAKNCIDSTPVGRKSQCALNMYNEIQGVTYNDYGKVASLKLATSMYGVLVKLDRWQITNDVYQGEMMRIINDFSSDLEEGRRRSNAENLEIARFRQQAFINAARILNPPKNGVNCVSVNQGFVTTTNCN